MPRRTDIKRIMIIGSGPIVIGQAAEFDFSGSQACKALREEGYEVVLVNSNPATIQTDASMADKVYVEPLDADTLARIIEKEMPDGILAGMGGQTALNLCSELARNGTLDRFGVRLLGTSIKAIEDSEDRDLFNKVMLRIGEPIMNGVTVNSVAGAVEAVSKIGGCYPVLIRPAYTLGGTGGGIAYDEGELKEISAKGLAYSRIRQVLIEESVLGWKEYEYEVMRDSSDNCIIICSMENIDPMGIHTGESIVVAPVQTLSDGDHQILRNAAIKIIRALRIEGGCNVQFAFNHDTGDYRVIEVNPRVSRSSALASKATGYSIARVAAKIAVGYMLDEIRNDVTGNTFASFEPALDYVITKIPRWPFDKFKSVDQKLGTQMKSTGEVMAIGRTIEESLLKAVRSLETGNGTLLPPKNWDCEGLEKELRNGTHLRLFAVAEALRRGMQIERIKELCGYDTFFLHKIANVVGMEKRLSSKEILKDGGLLREAKRLGLGDVYISRLSGLTQGAIRKARMGFGILPTYKMVDTCAAEFQAKTPYYYSSYEEESEIADSASRKCVILGSGPIRIGQGIEFDYCCVHAVQALREAGVETVMINNNPETVSTDYDTSDRLYFEPLTFEEVMNVIEAEKPDGVLVAFGGQTAINLAKPLENALAESGLKTSIWGTSPDAIALAEDRELFSALMRKLHIPQPESGTGHSFEDVREKAAKIGYPVLVRPSFVLGGRAMQIVYSEDELARYMEEAVQASSEHPILVDRFLSNAVEIDVDAVCDGEKVIIGAIMEHIEEAGIHSGDSACVIPPQTLSAEILKTVELYTKRIALALGTVGLINIQYAVKDNIVFILEANPRASRTVPFVSKAKGLPLAKIAARVALGEKLKDMDLREYGRGGAISVKAPVFSFLKLRGLDTVLGPEMKSTGEAMGIADSFGAAYGKAMMGAGNPLPASGTVFLAVSDADKDRVLPIAEELAEMGFSLVATRGTASFLRDFGLDVATAYKVSEKESPDAIDVMRSGNVTLVINTPSAGILAPERKDGFQMRRVAVDLQIPFISTLSAARAAVRAIRRMQEGSMDVNPLK